MQDIDRKVKFKFPKMLYEVFICCTVVYCCAYMYCHYSNTVHINAYTLHKYFSMIQQDEKSIQAGIIMHGRVSIGCSIGLPLITHAQISFMPRLAHLNIDPLPR